MIGLVPMMDFPLPLVRPTTARVTAALPGDARQ
jgi:hypothetical protein